MTFRIYHSHNRPTFTQFIWSPLGMNATFMRTYLHGVHVFYSWYGWILSLIPLSGTSLPSLSIDQSAICCGYNIILRWVTVLIFNNTFLGHILNFLFYLFLLLQNFLYEDILPGFLALEYYFPIVFRSQYHVQVFVYYSTFSLPPGTVKLSMFCNRYLTVLAEWIC